MTVYLLSILDGVSNFFTLVVCLSLCGVGVLALFSPILSDVWHDAEPREVRATVLAWIKRGITAAAAAGLLGAFVPTTETLLRAYVMAEGSKVVNAPNAQTAAAEILKRVDALIGKVGKQADAPEGKP